MNIRAQFKNKRLFSNDYIYEYNDFYFNLMKLIKLYFKILILQCYFNLSDDQTEFQINDRMSFIRF